MFKVGDRVRIISTLWIEKYELGKIGIIAEVDIYCTPPTPTYEVDMGRLRRPHRSDDNSTCWYLKECHLELVPKLGQLHFMFG